MFSYFWATLITFGFYIRVVLHALSPSSFSVFRGNVQFLSFAFERVSSLPCSRSSIEYIWPVFLFVWHYFGARFSVSWVTWIETRHRQTTGSERQKKKRGKIGVEVKVRATTRAWLRSHSIHQTARSAWRQVKRGRITAAATLSAFMHTQLSFVWRAGWGWGTHSVLFLLLATFPSLQL